MRADCFRREQAGEEPILVALADKIETVVPSLRRRRLDAPRQGLAPAVAVVLAGTRAMASDRAPRRIRIGEAMNIEE
jgi:hypothetical protein